MEKEIKTPSKNNSPEPKKGISKGILILSILIAIIITLIGAGLVYYFLIKPEPEPEKTAEELVPTTTQTTSQATTETTQEEKTEVTTPEKVDPYKDWNTYKNDLYNYQFKYPKTAKIEETKLTDLSMSPEESASGKTFEDLYAELTGKICIYVKLNPGMVSFSPSKNEKNFYTMCGAMTGIGTGYQVKKKTETVTINGKKYEASVMELIGKNDTLEEHSETLSVTVDDGTRISISSDSDKPKTQTWQDYLKNRPDLLKIVESYLSIKK
jgi:hypothetical protein